jgi:hypothetical protein
MRALSARPRGDYIVWAAVLTLVAFRSAVFVFRPQVAFDSDQAVWGLMAKHIAERRAFPLFMYGQDYLLAVEAWLTAPVFSLVGASATVLKIPLLAINTVVGLLLAFVLRREVGLDSSSTILASLFFLLAPPGTTAYLMDAGGGMIEPLLYTLLLWMTRRRATWFGLILGIGFLQREFTIYAPVSLALMALGQGAARRKDAWQHAWRVIRVTAEFWLVVQFLRPFASARGPGTRLPIQASANNIASVLRLLCFDWSSALLGIGRLFTVHWPRLFGTAHLAIASFNTESDAMQGAQWSGLVLAGMILLMGVRIVAGLRADPAAFRRCGFCLYLVVVGALSALVFAVSRCGDVLVMRYDLLSILGAVGVATCALAIESRQSIRRLEIAALLAWAMLSATAHAKVWAEQIGHRRIPDKELIVRHLTARGIRYAKSDYFIAYYVTFVTNERIIVAADNAVRIDEYQDEVNVHRREAIMVSRRPCGGEQPVISGVFFCAMP